MSIENRKHISVCKTSEKLLRKKTDKLRKKRQKFTGLVRDSGQCEKCNVGEEVFCGYMVKDILKILC